MRQIFSPGRRDGFDQELSGRMAGGNAAHVRIATAAFSMVAGIFGGIFAFNLFKSQPYNETIGVKRTLPPPAMGDVAPPSVNTVDVNGRWANGGMTMGKMADPQMVKPNRK